jgi:hypothetical protein
MVHISDGYHKAAMSAEGKHLNIQIVKEGYVNNIVLYQIVVRLL